MRNLALTAVLAAFLIPSIAQGGESRLSGDDIRAAYSGKRYYGVAPSGNIFQIDYQADGSFKGFVRDNADTGRWWVDGDRLCRSWNAWKTQKPEECFTVAFDEKWARWYRADGSLYRAWRRPVEAAATTTVARNTSGATQLTGDQIKRAYGGRRFYGDAPDGSVVLFDFTTGGASKAVVEEGETVQGRWWVDGDRLCRAWVEWNERHPEECFTIELIGDKAKWYRADGSLWRVFTIPG